MSTYLFGQLSDPNVKALHPLFDKFIDQDANIEWNITEDILYIEGKPVTDLTAIYMRNNVFEESTYKKYTNFHILSNYIQCHKVTAYNKDYHYQEVRKLNNLIIAKQLGLKIPYTEVTEKSAKDNTIIKPVTGGQHTLEGNEAVYPCIIQQKITGKNKTGVADARKHIHNIVNTPKVAKIKYEVGDKYEGTVKKIVDFGAFIELPDGTDGILHISKISDQRVEKVSDVVSEGDKITVEILEFKGNKISLGRA